jgi:hypothetical protein
MADEATTSPRGAGRAEQASWPIDPRAPVIEDYTIQVQRNRARLIAMMPRLLGRGPNGYRIHGRNPDGSLHIVAVTDPDPLG